MDEALIEAWNNKVPENAEVWHLGDFAFRAAKDLASYFNRLNGKIKFILGNHDVQKDLEKLAPVFIRKEIRWNKNKIILDHYALRSWNASFHGSWHLYGHSHNNLESEPYGRSMDVGVDSAAALGFGYAPLAIEEIAEILEKREKLHV
jgi:calcineurin-like phosphoesterase family protein